MFNNYLITLTGQQTQQDQCTSSRECTFGTSANCCDGICSTYWSTQCASQKCAEGEIWIPNDSGRYCLNITNPCSGRTQNYNPCSNGNCTAMSTKNGNGLFWCSNCPDGLGGQLCELCASSKACGASGTTRNCCNSNCVTYWSGICEKYGCAQGEYWDPKHNSEQKCIPNS